MGWHVAVSRTGHRSKAHLVLRTGEPPCGYRSVVWDCEWEQGPVPVEARRCAKCERFEREGRCSTGGYLERLRRRGE
jgi:hypothetical protein